MSEPYIDKNLPFSDLPVSHERYSSSALDEEKISTVIPRESWFKARLDADGRAVLEVERGYLCDPDYYDGYSLTCVWIRLQTFTMAFDLAWLRWRAAQENHLYLPLPYADPAPPPSVPEPGKPFRLTADEIRQAPELRRLGTTMHHVVGLRSGGAFMGAPSAGANEGVCPVHANRDLVVERIRLAPGETSISQLAGVLRAQGKRFARLDETLAFDARFPWRGEREMLYCLGSSYEHPPTDDGRSLKLARIDYMVPCEYGRCARLCARIFYLDQVSLEQMFIVTATSFAASYYLAVLNDPL